MSSIAFHDIESLIKLAIDEDIRTGDVTGEAIFEKNDGAEAYIV